MDEHPLESRMPKQRVGKDDLVRYVEELAGSDDAWISLTDAARITRSSEAGTRRWVTSGRIPVKKDPVGVPPRTRLVRLSDVAAIRPIIDPTVAITDEVRKLDLASIPRQQKQVMEDHQRLIAQAEIQQKMVEQFTRQFQQALHDLEGQLQRQDSELHQALTEQSVALQEHFAGQVNEVRDIIEAQRGQLESLFNDSRRQIGQVRDEFATALATQDQAQKQCLDDAIAPLKAQDLEQQSRLATVGTTLEQVQHELERIRKQYHEDIQGVRRAANNLVEQHARDVDKQLEELGRGQVRDIATLATQLEESFTTRLKQITNEASTAQSTQDQRLKQLEGQLEAERKARQLLSQQLEDLMQSVNALHALKAKDKPGKGRQTPRTSQNTGS